MSCLILREGQFDLNALSITSALGEGTKESEGFLVGFFFFKSLSLKLTKTAAIFFSVAKSDASEFSLAPQLTLFVSLVRSWICF